MKKPDPVFSLLSLKTSAFARQVAVGIHLYARDTCMQMYVSTAQPVLTVCVRHGSAYHEHTICYNSSVTCKRVRKRKKVDQHTLKARADCLSCSQVSMQPWVISSVLLPSTTWLLCVRQQVRVLLSYMCSASSSPCEGGNCWLLTLAHTLLCSS